MCGVGVCVVRCSLLDKCPPPHQHHSGHLLCVPEELARSRGVFRGDSIWPPGGGPHLEFALCRAEVLLWSCEWGRE